MSKQDILTISIISLCVIAIILLVLRLTKASKEAVPMPPTTQQEEVQADTFPTETDTSWVSDTQSGFEPGENMADESTATPSASQPANSRTEEPPNAESNEGNYLVLAGSFTLRANAEKFAKTLRAKGYSSARVEIFNRGKYAVVLVDRFNNLDEARDLQQRLKADGIDSYVKLKGGATQ